MSIGPPKKQTTREGKTREANTLCERKTRSPFQVFVNARTVAAAQSACTKQLWSEKKGKSEGGLGLMEDFFWGVLGFFLYVFLLLFFPGFLIGFLGGKKNLGVFWSSLQGFWCFFVDFSGGYGGFLTILMGLLGSTLLLNP